MGDQHATPGKAEVSTQVANADPVAQQQSKFPSSYTSGIAEANDGIKSSGQGRCRNIRGVGCFLEPSQRTEANSQARGQLALVANNYAIAVEQCRVGELIKKIDELPWYASLLLGAAIAVVESLVPMAGAAFVAAGKATQALAKVGAETVKKAADSELKTLTKAQITSTIKAATTLGKTNAVKSFTAASSDQSEQANAKTQALGYMNTLNKSASIMWKQLNRDIGTMDDATVMVLLESLDPTILSIEKFLGEVTAALARYAASNVSKIGRESTYDGNRHVEKEIRIARIVPAFGGPPYLVYQDRVFDGWYRDVRKRNEQTTERSGVYDDPRNAFSLDQEADWKIDGKKQRGKQEPIREDRILKRVEPEFEELAKAKQKDTWLNDIETFQITWVNGQQKIIKVAGS